MAKLRTWLPWLLLAPQALVIGVFFFWPAGQALVQSFQMQDSFGMSTEWVGLENFRNLFEDPSYLASFKTTAFFSILVAVVGIGLIVSQSIVLFNALKWAAAAYLLYIGFKALRAQPAKTVTDDLHKEAGERTARGAFTSGFVTNGLNPKATLFFLSLFTVVINPHTPLTVQAGYGIYLAVATATWFCLVAMLFSQQRVRAGFARMGHWFDRTMGAVLIAIGVKLAFTEMH